MVEKHGHQRVQSVLPMDFYKKAILSEKWKCREDNTVIFLDKSTKGFSPLILIYFS